MQDGGGDGTVGVEKRVRVASATIADRTLGGLPGSAAAGL
jgi:hypothetical protein